MPTTSPEDAKANFRVQFGEELGEALYATICNFMLLTEHWADYCSLYGTSPERVALLNETAPEFFGRLQNTMWDGILLTLSRLTDPAKSPPKRKNLSILQLTELVADPKLRSELTLLQSVAVARCDFARVRRNKRIAHADLELALNPHATALPSATRQKIKLSICSIQSYLEILYAHYSHSAILLEPLDPGFEADFVMSVLENGLTPLREPNLTPPRKAQIPK